MKEVFEVLMYVFDNHLQSNSLLMAKDPDLIDELFAIGFDPIAVAEALTWLDDLMVLVDLNKATRLEQPASIRLFDDDEMVKLDISARNHLLFLENIGILDSLSRELVIERAMAFNTEYVDMADIKIITLLVLFNQPDKIELLTEMEHLMLTDALDTLH